jgi:hypothetical protein
MKATESDSEQRVDGGGGSYLLPAVGNFAAAAVSSSRSVLLLSANIIPLWAPAGTLPQRQHALKQYAGYSTKLMHTSLAVVSHPALQLRESVEGKISHSSFTASLPPGNFDRQLGATKARSCGQ